MPVASEDISDDDAGSRGPGRTVVERCAISATGDSDVFQLPSPLPSPSEPPIAPQPEGDATDVRQYRDTKPPEARLDTAIPNTAGGKLPVSLSAGAQKPADRSHLPGVRRLSATKMAELAESLPIATVADGDMDGEKLVSLGGASVWPRATAAVDGGLAQNLPRTADLRVDSDAASGRDGDIDEPSILDPSGHPRVQKHWSSTSSLRSLAAPTANRRRSSATQPTPGGQAVALQPATSNTSTRRHSHNIPPRPPSLHIDSGNATTASALRPGPQLLPKPLDPLSNGELRLPSPIPPSIPLPPMSLPTLLQLELAGQRPSPLYIHHSHTAEILYESNAVKFERLKNFLLLPTYLERTIYFGALACLDAWLWTLTILPIRFSIALSVLVRWWAYVVSKEVRWLTAYVWRGLGRMWARGRLSKLQAVTETSDESAPKTTPVPGNGRPHSRSNGSSEKDNMQNVADANQPLQLPRQQSQLQPQLQPQPRPQSKSRNLRSAQTPAAEHAAPPPAPLRTSQKPGRHRRTKSMPSNLTSFHKADLLQGAVILCSCVALMNLDASRMYHFIRAQSAVKLYVIYNLVEVGDRLLSAVGQDVFECLFSSETLSRTSSGRSKILLPFGMFCLSLAYNIAHSVVLFYQVITLNVAVNSYSNALLSLLMSNQFVEVKSSVFKRTEKENTFQLACADIVERFQLWIVLFIIALRNVVEIGGLSVPGAGIDLGGGSSSGGNGEDGFAKVPLHNASILPASFTMLPSWLVSVEVLSPFLIVIGSEMIVDWIKHGYINKFNNIKPNFYSRVLDILCKDYYTNAFLAPALIRRLGLPLIPLCTLFIRSSIQTYHMFLATHLPSPMPPSTHTSLAVESATPSSPAMAASLERLDLLIRNALGRAVHGNPYSAPGDAASAVAVPGWRWWSSDDLIAGITMTVVFFIMFLLLLIAKLLLGMALLRYARNRYAAMKLQEHAEALGKTEPESFDATGKRTGGYGKVEVGEERRRWIFQDDPEGLKKVRERERRDMGKGKKEMDLNLVTRYEMIAKRIW